MDNKCAYVTLLMGDTMDFLSNLILIKSLLNTETKHDTILLFTFVPKYKLDILKKYYTKLVEVDKYFITTQKPEMADIFTRLKVFTLKEYDKVVFLCNNMYVNRNIDNVFEKYDAPAGVVINQKYKNGQRIDKNNVVINSCFRLLKPSMGKYKKMIYALQKFNTTNQFEEEFVSYYFNKQWTNISNKYNYEFNLENSNKINVDDIYVINYESAIKPWEILCDFKLYNSTEVKNYYFFYKKWLRLFVEIYNEYMNEGINLLIKDYQFRDLEKYMRREYPSLVLVELNEYQKKKIKNKMDEVIENSTTNNSHNYTYTDIINELNKGEHRVFIYGGAVRNLFNDEEINDIDVCYDNKPKRVEKILKTKFENLRFRTGGNIKSNFKIGLGDNTMDLFDITKIDTYRNAPVNSLILDTKTNIVYDIYGRGIKNSVEKIFVKPPDQTYEKWLTAAGVANVRLGRLLKFMMKGYKTLEEDRKQVYNDWYKNKNEKMYFKRLLQFFKNDAKLKLDFLKDDVDKLNLEFTGQQFIDKLIKKMNLRLNNNNKFNNNNKLNNNK